MQLKKASKIALAAASLLSVSHVATVSAEEPLTDLSSYWDEVTVEKSTQTPLAKAIKASTDNTTNIVKVAPVTQVKAVTRDESTSKSKFTFKSLGDWKNEASALYYAEGDDRVEDKSFKYKGVLTTPDENILSIRVGADSLTGASPSGGAPLTTAQTVTSPSGVSSTVYPENELVLDDGFQDERVDAGISWDQSIIDKKTRANAGVSVSKENDYLHLGVSGGITREFNNKDTTVSLGGSYSSDTIEPVFNIAAGLTDITTTEGPSEESKETVDFVVGVSQILSKKTILQLNYGISQANGYLNDTYKRISRVNSEGTEVVQTLNESRPDQRLGHNLYAGVRHLISGNVLNTSARLHTDDFGIDSFTLDAKYKIKLGKKHSIEPHVRYYTQTAADFYYPQLDADTPLPEYASSDYRLAEFESYSLGATYRFTAEDDKEWRITTEVYSQDPTEVETTEGQAGLNANPGFNALIVGVGVKF